MKKSRDVVAYTIDAFREGLRAAYRDALPEIFSDDFFLAIDERVRREFGGGETYIQKTPQRVEVAKTRAIAQFARGATAPAAAGSNGISRATIYRALNRKTGGGR